MKTRLARHAAAIAMLTLAAPGLADAAIAVPDGFAGPQQTAPAAAPQPAGPHWWAILAAPELDGLMARLPQGNAALAEAAARLALARADAGQSRAALLPQVAAEAGASQARGPLVNAAGESGALFTLRAGATWEPDLFGRMAATSRAATFDARAAEQDAAALRLAVETALARSWIAARAGAAQAALAERQVALRTEDLAMAERSAAAGMAPVARVDVARLALAEARRDAVVAQQRRDAARAAMALLLGEPGLAPAPEANLLPDLPGVPAGLPAAMLARRADVAAAQDRLAAADARVDAARRLLLPGLLLTGNGGAASSGLGALLGAAARSVTFGMIAGLPLFDGGRRKAERARRNAERDLAEARLTGTVLAALHGVDGALRGVAATRAAADAGETALGLSETRAAAARDAAAQGTVPRRAALTAELDLAAARARLVERRAESAAALVTLIGELGGDWGEPAAPSRSDAQASSGQ
jgi:multidrug efflux system outer membrane protein